MLVFLNEKYDKEEFIINEHTVAYFMYLLTNVTTRTSVMYNVMLISIRIINVFAPTYNVNFKGVLVTLVLVILAWFAFLSVDLYLVSTDCENKIKLPVTSTGTGIPLSPAPGPPEGQILVKLFVLPLTGIHVVSQIIVYIPVNQEALELLIVKGVPFIIPSCIALTGAVVLVVKLLLGTPLGLRSKINRRISWTVLYLTLLFVCCNIPDVILLVVFHNPLSKHNISHLLSIVRFVTSVVLPYVNACCSPLILIIRGTNIRWALIKLFLS